MAEKNSKLLSAFGQVALAIFSGFSGALFSRAMTPAPPQPPVQEVAIPTRDGKADDDPLVHLRNLLTDLPSGSPPEGTYQISFRSVGKEVSVVTVRVPDYLVVGSSASVTPEVESGQMGPQFMLEYAPSFKEPPLRLELNREYMRNLLTDLNVDKDVHEHMESVDEVRIVRTAERPLITNQPEE